MRTENEWETTHAPVFPDVGIWRNLERAPAQFSRSPKLLVPGATPGNELTGTLAEGLAFFGDENAAQIRTRDLASHAATAERGPPGLGQHVFVAQCPLAGRVHQDDVGVRAGGEPALA